MWTFASILLLITWIIWGVEWGLLVFVIVWGSGKLLPILIFYLLPPSQKIILETDRSHFQYLEKEASFSEIEREIKEKKELLKNLNSLYDVYSDPSFGRKRKAKQYKEKIKEEQMKLKILEDIRKKKQ